MSNAPTARRNQTPAAWVDRSLRAAFGMLLALACLLPIGCGSQSLDTTYGRRRGGNGAESINGTRVFAQMFRQAGYRVSTWTRLSPKIEDFDTIVWAPNSFTPPSEEEREYLEGWLGNEPGRTLIYIGRDYDAEVDYWNTVLPLAPPDQVMEINRRLARAQSRHSEARAKMPDEEYARWFITRRGQGRREGSELKSGPGASVDDSDWVRDIDVSKTHVVFEGRLDAPLPSDVPKGESTKLPDAEVLLAAGDAPLVTRVSESAWGDSKIIVVANGSFLLNLPLVNHEHRKIAARLVEECGEPGNAAFLESGPTGLAIFDQEPENAYATGAEVFTVWPLGLIVIHLVAAGILFCFIEFPIFGRPKARFHVAAANLASDAVVGVLNIVIVRKTRDPSTSHADFGSHISALGELLQRTGDESYAQARISHYHQHVRRESSAALADNATPPLATQPTGSVPHE